MSKFGLRSPECCSHVLVFFRAELPMNRSNLVCGIQVRSTLHLAGTCCDVRSKTIDMPDPVSSSGTSRPDPVSSSGTSRHSLAEVVSVICLGYLAAGFASRLSPSADRCRRFESDTSQEVGVSPIVSPHYLRRSHLACGHSNIELHSIFRSGLI